MDPPELQHPQEQLQTSPALAEEPADPRPDAASGAAVVDETQELTSERTELDASQDAGPDWDDDGDSAIGIPNYESSTTSVTPSVFEGVEEFGRTYHSYKSGKYALPNDEKEQDRMDLQHAMFTQLIGGRLARAPIDSIPLHNVLDLATGTGIWAIDFAESHPSANVIGTDLSPIQPVHVPINCSFEIDDAEDEWLFKKPFSYIHGRALIMCFRDNPHVIRSAYKALAPGGYLEFQDPTFPLLFADPQPPPDSPYVRWQQLVYQGAAAAGRPWTHPSSYKGWMEQAGFADVREEKFFFPTGAWAAEPRLRRIGAWQLANWLEIIEAITPRMLSSLHWEIEEIKVLVAQVRDEFRKGNLKPYCDFWCVYGRKPEAKEEETAEGGAGAAP